VRILRYLKAVILLKGRILCIPIGLLQCLGILFIIDIANALKEQERKDKLLIVPGINMPPQISRRSP
jgi:hypothetical protein